MTTFFSLLCQVMVNPEDVGDASRVKVEGPTLKEGRTHEDNTFRVDTKNAGYGGLSLSVEGPSKAEIKCKVWPHTHFFTGFRKEKPVSKRAL